MARGLKRGLATLLSLSV